MKQAKLKMACCTDVWGQSREWLQCDANAHEYHSETRYHHPEVQTMKLSYTKQSNLILQVLSCHSTHTPTLDFSLPPPEHTTYLPFMYLLIFST